MDFGYRVTAPASLASVEVDGLVLVVVGEAVDAALAAPLAGLIGDAVTHGDLALKKGKSLYVHRPAGVAARRVAVAVSNAAPARMVRTVSARKAAALRTHRSRSAEKTSTIRLDTAST